MSHTASAVNGMSGSIDGQDFTTTGFTITSIADTVNINGVFLTHTSSSIAINGVGVFDFVTATSTFSNNGIVGFGRDQSGDLYNGPANNNWDLMSDVFLVGTARLFQWPDPDVITSGGVLEFASQNGIDATFRAVVGDPDPIPLPAGVVLLVTGVAGFGAFRRRKA
jgi:hypothetical protein